jgi:hypothetical protein
LGQPTSGGVARNPVQEGELCGQQRACDFRQRALNQHLQAYPSMSLPFYQTDIKKQHHRIKAYAYVHRVTNQLSVVVSQFIV